MMGGGLTVESQLEVGTVFRFELATPTIAELPPLQKPDRPMTGLAANQPHFRILVVENNNDHRRLLTSLLQSYGFDVRDADNGQGAIDLWRTFAPYLIWMDRRLPNLDSYFSQRQRRSSRQGDGVSVWRG